MANKTVPLYRPGQDFTAYCTTDVEAERLAFYAAPVEGEDHPLFVAATRPADGAIPAGVVGFSQKQGQTVHITSGHLPIESAVDADAGSPAYAAEDGRVTNVPGVGEANALVGVYARPAQADAAAIIDLHL